MHPAGSPAIIIPDIIIPTPDRTSTGGGGGRSTTASSASSSSA
jgi:hypothetical protein